MDQRSVTLYGRPDCPLCDEALTALRAIAAASPAPLVIHEENIEHDPDLHRRLLSEIPAISYEGKILTHATSRMRMESFINAVDSGAKRV
jgi:hypothetical protein